MINAAPQTLDATPEILSTLADDITGYGLMEAHGVIDGVWLLRGDQTPLLVRSSERDLAFKFEVFTLQISTAAEALDAAHAFRPVLERIVAEINTVDAGVSLPPLLTAEPEPGPCLPWPFTRWQVDVLWAREWLLGEGASFGELAGGQEVREFGWIPDCAKHACLVSRGLMFTGDDGRRLLIDQADMPLQLVVTREETLIERALEGVLVIPLDRYLTDPLPAV